MKKTARNDLLLIGGLLLLALALYLVFQAGASRGGQAVVRVEDRVVGRYPLDRDGVFPLNGGTNVLVIGGGKAWIERADCPDKICVRQGRIFRNGQRITCLPNRLTVTGEGGAGDGADLVS